MKDQIVIYQTRSGAIELRSDTVAETIWANLDQIATIFGRDKSVVSRHIKNIFKDRELIRDSVVAFFATTAADGKSYNVEYFNLDIILSFTDGNKRNGAYAFVWFLRQARILDASRMTPSALTALTILVAESSPKDKEKIIRLILMLLAKGRKSNK